MSLYLPTKFQASSIILTSFRQGPSPQPQKEPLKSPPRLGLHVKICLKFKRFKKFDDQNMKNLV